MQAHMCICADCAVCKPWLRLYLLGKDIKCRKSVHIISCRRQNESIECCSVCKHLAVPRNRFISQTQTGTQAARNSNGNSSKSNILHLIFFVPSPLFVYQFAFSLYIVYGVFCSFIVCKSHFGCHWLRLLVWHSGIYVLALQPLLPLARSCLHACHVKCFFSIRCTFHGAAFTYVYIYVYP